MTSAQRKAISKEWLQVAEDALSSATELRELKRYRSSVSRSYYAAYSFLASALVLEQSVQFRDGREGPEHEPLSDLVAVHLRRAFAPSALKQVRVGVRTLYGARLEADYRPTMIVRETLAADALRWAAIIANNVRRIYP